MPQIPTKDELNPPPKPRKRIWVILELLGKIALKMVIKNQRGVKGTKNEKVVDDVIDSI